MKILISSFLLFISSMAYANDTTFVFAQINESIMPLERGAKYGDPLNKFLSEKKIGEVTGGGSSIGKDGKIEWVGIDIELKDLKTNLPLVIKKLKSLGAPKGSILEYTVNKKKTRIKIH